MIRAKISILALYNWDSTLFDLMKLPSEVDKNYLKNKILFDAGRLGAVYPDSDFMKESIHYWSLTRLESWQKIAEALALDYEPLYNKDAYYTETEKRDLDKAENGSTSGTSRNSETTEGTNIDSIKGYNSSLWAEHDKSHNTGSTGSSGTTSGTSKNTTAEDETINRTRREYGNIGVTTSQQMLESEIELRTRYNIYEIITREFIERYCLMVY